jgi:16S rRNA (uracil1498-N3)-methyltransferase
MAERFYVNLSDLAGQVVLTGPEAHHLSVVCRVRVGSAVVLFNGDGLEYPATVVAVGKRAVELEVGQAIPVDREHSGQLILAAPLPKGDRTGFLIEKLTELGATAFIPLRTQRSVIDPGEGKAEKLRRQVIEAAKQCGRNRLMVIEPPQDLAVLLTRNDLPKERWLAHPGGAAPSPARNLVAAVGPEGGFTAEEVAAAQTHGWKLVGLGPRVLRIETAAIALAASTTVRA